MLSPDRDMHDPQPAAHGAEEFAKQCGHVARIADGTGVRAAQQRCPEGAGCAPSAVVAFAAQQHKPWEGSVPPMTAMRAIQAIHR